MHSLKDPIRASSPELRCLQLQFLLLLQFA
jgi:hypothetical protein